MILRFKINNRNGQTLPTESMLKTSLMILLILAKIRVTITGYTDALKQNVLCKKTCDSDYLIAGKRLLILDSTRDNKTTNGMIHPKQHSDVITSDHTLYMVNAEARHYRFSKDSTQWNDISATVNRKKYILKYVVYNTNIYDQKIASWFSKLYRSHTRSQKDKSIHHHDRDNPFCWPHIHYTDSKEEESNIVPSKEGDPLYHYPVSYEVCDVLKAFDGV